MQPREIKVGQLVYSRAGRDRGRPFLVWQIADSRRVFVVDGIIRRTAKPKAKNIIHIQAVNRIDLTIAERLKQGEIITDAEVRKTIARLIGTQGA